MPVGAGLARPAGSLSPGRARCETSARIFRRRRRRETERSDPGTAFSFFSHSFFARERKNGKKKKRILSVGFLPRRTRTLRWAHALSCAWQERAWRERTAFRASDRLMILFPRMSAHSVRSGAPQAVIGHRGRSRASFSGVARFFLCRAASGCSRGASSSPAFMIRRQICRFFPSPRRASGFSHK